MQICGTSRLTVRRATEEDQLVKDGVYQVGQLVWDCKRCGEMWRIHPDSMNDPQVTVFLEEEGGE